MELKFKGIGKPPFDRTVLTNGTHWSPRMLWETIWSKVIPAAKNPGTSKLLDIGCATHAWKTSDYVVERADINTNFKNYSVDKTNIFHHIDCDKTDNWPIADKTYEFSTAIDLIEHVQNPWNLVRQLARISSRGVIITTPNTESKLSLDLFRMKGHLFGFTPAEIREAHHVTPIFGWQMKAMADKSGCILSEFEFRGIPWDQQPLITKAITEIGCKELLTKENESQYLRRIFILTKI